MNVEKNNGAETSAESFTTEEKAQYEVFKNGQLPRDTIAAWIRTDIKSASSLLSTVLSEKEVFEAIVDTYYQRYKKLHPNVEENSN